MKTEHKIGIASVLVAAIGAGLSFYVGMWGGGGTGPTPSTNTIGDITGDNVTIIQTYAEAKRELDASPNDEQDFIGALDGIYEFRKDGLLVTRAIADFGAQEIAFVVGNCSFSGPTLQKGKSWLVYKAETDGICAFLDEIPTGYPVARIIPIPRKMSNSGKVGEFFVESAEFAIDEISGTYEWTGWNRE